MRISLLVAVLGVLFTSVSAMPLAFANPSVEEQAPALTEAQIVLGNFRNSVPGFESSDPEIQARIDNQFKLLEAQYEKFTRVSPKVAHQRIEKLLSDLAALRRKLNRVNREHYLAKHMIWEINEHRQMLARLLIMYLVKQETFAQVNPMEKKHPNYYLETKLPQNQQAEFVFRVLFGIAVGSATTWFAQDYLTSLETPVAYVAASLAGVAATHYPTLQYDTMSLVDLIRHKIHMARCEDTLTEVLIQPLRIKGRTGL